MSFYKNPYKRNAMVKFGLQNGLALHLPDGSATIKRNKRKNNNSHMNIDDDGVFTVHEDSFENILDNSSSSNNRMMIIENNNDFNDMVESRNDGLMRIGNDDVNDTIGMEEFKEDIDNLDEIDDNEEDKDKESIDSLDVDSF
jgi:hypothetical protein